jgi:hypothetical protein
MLGDDAYDATYRFLEDLGALYKDAFGRRPSLDELCALLEIELAVSGSELLHDCEERKVTQVAIKTQKKPKDQTFREGDVFAVPLAPDRYAFGRIMRMSKQHGTLFEFFRETARKPVFRPSILDSGRVFHPTSAAHIALKEWRWRVVLSDEAYAMSKEDHQLEFASPGPRRGEWSVVDIDSKILRKVDEATAKTLERAGSYHPQRIEERLRQALG